MIVFQVVQSDYQPLKQRVEAVLEMAMTTVDSLSKLFTAPPRDVELNPFTSLDAPSSKDGEPDGEKGQINPPGVEDSKTESSDLSEDGDEDEDEESEDDAVDVKRVEADMQEFEEGI